MRSFVTLATALLWVGLGWGCGDDALSEGPRQVELPEEQTAPPPSARPQLYTPTGELMESDEVLAGLKLPRGLTSTVDEERRHVYLTTVPLVRLQQYFGTRLMTGEVDQLHSGGVSYRNAVPRDARGGVVKLNVTLTPTGRNENRVEVVEIMPPPVNPPTEEEIRRRMREDMEKAM